MRCADDQCCGARAASSEPAGRTVPRPYTARDRSTATAAETVEQTRATSKHSGEQCRNYAMTGKRCLPHPWWRDAHELGPEAASALRRFNRAIERQGQESRLCPGNEGDVIDVGPEGMKR